MITSILAYVALDASTTSRIALNFLIPCILFLPVIAFCVLVVYGLIQLIRFLASARKEQKLIRMELSKLAEGVHQMRQESKETLDQKGDD